MKILLFGKHGQLGWELNRSLQMLGEVTALGREDVDFSNPESLRTVIDTVQPAIIINAVAYTAVDKAEEEVSLATAINETAPAVLAQEATKRDILLVHYSTDYVFDGSKDGAYLETDKPAPVNVYGRTKLAGEQAVQQAGGDYLIFRTSWVYASRGHNFLLTILRLAGERDSLTIVNDQLGSPTSARLIADTSVLCLQQSLQEKAAGNFMSDLYHLTTSGQTSWHGFAEAIMHMAADIFQQPLKLSHIQAIPTRDYPTPAKRPLNSRLQLTRLEQHFAVTMPDWKRMLQLCMEEIKE